MRIVYCVLFVYGLLPHMGMRIPLNGPSGIFISGNKTSANSSSYVTGDVLRKREEPFINLPLNELPSRISIHRKPSSRNPPINVTNDVKLSKRQVLDPEKSQKSNPPAVLESQDPPETSPWNIFEDAWKWTKTAIKDVANAVTEARETVDKTLDEASEDVKTWTVEAAKDTGKWTVEAAKDTGMSLSQKSSSLTTPAPHPSKNVTGDDGFSQRQVQNIYLPLKVLASGISINRKPNPSIDVTNDVVLSKRQMQDSNLPLNGLPQGISIIPNLPSINVTNDVLLSKRQVQNINLPLSGLPNGISIDRNSPLGNPSINVTNDVVLNKRQIQDSHLPLYGLPQGISIIPTVPSTNVTNDVLLSKRQVQNINLPLSGLPNGISINRNSPLGNPFINVTNNVLLNKRQIKDSEKPPQIDIKLLSGQNNNVTNDVVLNKRQIQYSEKIPQNDITLLDSQDKPQIIGGSFQDDAWSGLQAVAGNMSKTVTDTGAKAVNDVGNVVGGTLEWTNSAVKDFGNMFG